MIGVSLYILACSARNRFRVRMRRLREPRYLIGAIVGAAYMYFTFFARFRGRGRGTPTRFRGAGDRRSGSSGLISRTGVDLLGLVFFAGAALGWLLPFNAAMLDFTDAEIHFLFPAPVGRRDLLIHRLVRSQLGLLFTAIVATLAFPSAAWPGRLRFAIGMWVILMTTRVYYTGVSLARTRLTSRAPGPRRVAWIPLVLIVCSAVVVAGSFMLEFGWNPPNGPTDLMTRAHRVVASGAARLVLWPFAALTRPLFAPWTAPFLTALAWALGVLAAAFAWMVTADAAVQELAGHGLDTERLSVQQARRAERQRARTVRARATGLTLAPRGPAEGVFFWKNGVQTLRAGGGTLLRYVMPLVVLIAAMTSLVFSVAEARNGAAAACLVALGMATFICVLGPQIVRTDLRSDLSHLDLLKTWPIRPSAVVRGEMLWPVALLTTLAWLAISCAAMFSAAAFPETSLGERLSYAAAALLVIPAVLAAQYLVQNAAAVYFPAWVPLGDQRPRGVDALGQRLIMLAGVLLAVAILFVPATAAAAIVWYILWLFLGAAAWVPAAAVCTALVVVEVLAATEALGPVYERLDIMAVERGE